MKSNVLPPSERFLEPGGALAELRTIRRALESADKERDDTVNVQVARAYQIAYVYEHNPEAYLEFCRETKWKGRKPSPERPNEAIRFVVRQLVRKKDPKKKAKTVYLYASALFELRDLGVRPADVIATIESTDNGLNGLSAAGVTRKRARLKLTSPQQNIQPQTDSVKLPESKQPADSARSKKTERRVSRVQLPKITCLKAIYHIPSADKQSGKFVLQLPGGKWAFMYH